MAVTQAAIRSAVQLELYSAGVTERPYRTRLTAAILAADTTIPVIDGEAWSVDDTGEFADGEQFVVTAVAVNNLTVIRESGASDQADAATVYKNPKISIKQIDEATEGVLEDLRTDLWLLHTKTLTYDPTTQWYPFEAAGDTDIYKVLTVYYKPSGQDHPSPVEYWRYQRETAVADFTATSGLILSSGLSLDTGDNIHVVCRKRIAAITDLPDEYKRIVVIGVVYSLLGAADIRRIHDPGKRTDRTVQPGSEARTSIWYLREYIRRRDRAMADLAAQEDHLPKSRIAQRARRYRI